MKTALIFAAVLVGASTATQAACPSWPTSTRFTFSEDGSKVIDLHTNLVWKRCSEGQIWNGRDCEGAAIKMKLDAALKHASTQNSWRLPDIKELSSLSDVACPNLVIDQVAFPSTPPVWYLSASTNSNEYRDEYGGVHWGLPWGWGWGVDFSNGYVYRISVGDPLAVRLVQDNQ